MSRYTPPRSDIARPTPPDPFRYANMVMEPVIDPLADRIWKGDPLLGWDGDSRLQLYFAPRDAKWCLARYCEDKVWRVLLACPATPANAAIVVGDVISHLLDTDSRRGVNMAAEIAAANQRVTDQQDADLTDWLAEEGLPRAARRRLAAHG